MFAVDHDYLKTYKLDVVAGRGFSEEFGDELNRVVLNEEAVRLLGYTSNEAALGKQLKMEVLDEPLQIIVVVKNYYQQSLATSYKPILFFMKERVPIIGHALYFYRFGREVFSPVFGRNPADVPGFFPKFFIFLFFL